MAIRLDTNLSDLPFQLFQQLSSCLSSGDIWMKLLDDDKKNGFYSSPEEIERLLCHPSPVERVLRMWGMRGQTVQSLLARLQMLSAVHGGLFDKPQLILHRKFKEVRWSQPCQITVTPSLDTYELLLESTAIGFPFPSFQWLRDGEVIQGETSCSLRINKCKCELSAVYTCRVWNEVEPGLAFSEFYRQKKKTFESELISDPVELQTHIPDGHVCERCKQNEIEKIREIMSGVRTNDGAEAAPPSDAVAAAAEELVAADKVALIISNCQYRYLPQLITPHCDAETLAQALQEMHFKTVTLADLTLPEMQFIIREYRRLLGNDIYAVLYFAGHGFEVNGQCYLLPIEAPMEEAHAPEHCISMDWILAMMAGHTPSLNLILLDVCRKYIPVHCVPKFIELAEQYKKKYKANRNTVYGYSTSGGVGAYEVKGDINGVFMKYLKAHLTAKTPVLDMLHRVFRDIEADPRVRDVQIPELRSTLTRPRSLTDPLISDGHTVSFHHHTIHWRLMHELPNPVTLKFVEQELTVTVWFDYCGHFTNKVYVFSSVGDLHEEGSDEDQPLQEKALSHLANLKFGKELQTSKPRIVTDDEEGVSLCLLLSNLQRANGEIRCQVELTEKATNTVVATQETLIGHVLITRIDMLK